MCGVDEMLTAVLKQILLSDRIKNHETLAIDQPRPLIVSLCHWLIRSLRLNACFVAQSFRNAVMSVFWFPARCHLGRCLAPENSKSGQSGGSCVKPVSSRVTAHRQSGAKV